MSYEEAVEATVTRNEARQEIARHNAEFSEFLEDVGDRADYTGAEVLDWLGY